MRPRPSGAFWAWSPSWSRVGNFVAPRSIRSWIAGARGAATAQRPGAGTAACNCSTVHRRRAAPLPRPPAARAKLIAARRVQPLAVADGRARLCLAPRVRLVGVALHALEGQAAAAQPGGGAEAGGASASQAPATANRSSPASCLQRLARQAARVRPEGQPRAGGAT